MGSPQGFCAGQHRCTQQKYTALDRKLQSRKREEIEITMWWEGRGPRNYCCSLMPKRVIILNSYLIIPSLNRSSSHLWFGYWKYLLLSLLLPKCSLSHGHDDELWTMIMIQMPVSILTNTGSSFRCQSVKHCKKYNFEYICIAVVYMYTP